MKMRWYWVAVAPVIWLVFGLLWAVGAAVGIPLTYIAARRGAFEFLPGTGDGNAGTWAWTWRWMSPWQTWDNNACPIWYAKWEGEHVILKLPSWEWLGRFAGRPLWTKRWNYSERPIWKNLWMFAGFRNAFGGNPFNVIVPPRWIAYRSDNGSPVRLTVRMMQDRVRGECKRLYWNITQYEWRVGFHIIIPFSTKPTARNSHIEIRHGYKLYPDAPAPQMMVFSVWDTGFRFR